MNNSTDKHETLLKLGAAGAIVFAAVQLGKKLFGVRGNPARKNALWTKKEINDETTVRHISRNDYSYNYRTADGRRFSKDDLNHDIILEEETALGPDYHRIGYATNKKEFVDEVYNYLNG